MSAEHRIKGVFCFCYMSVGAPRVGGCGRFSVPLGSWPETPSVLHRALPAQRLLDAALVVEAQVGIEHRRELLHGNAAPVAMEEELVLKPTEEALHGGVVRAASFLRHRPHQAVSLA